MYEIRYEAADGKASVMKARFPNHDIELPGVFESQNDTSRLTYLTRSKSEEDRDKARAAFAADPEWLVAQAATEVNGPLLKNQMVSVLSPAVAGLLLG